MKEEMMLRKWQNFCYTVNLILECIWMNSIRLPGDIIHGYDSLRSIQNPKQHEAIRKEIKNNFARLFCIVSLVVFILFAVFQTTLILTIGLMCLAIGIAMWCSPME